ncbi:enoyl-CoA hydratase [Candidatus Methanophagaceae archaeon]|nr:enoyl-CoA hydratase [Methanophagales archaeon]
MTEVHRKTVLLYEKHGKVATVTLNRPKALNALNTGVLKDLRDALVDAEADADIHVIVLTGAGDRAFCAGADIQELRDKSAIEARDWSLWVQEITSYMERVRKPILAKINGFCLGGGLELAMACDFRIATDKSLFGLPEVNLAIIPGGGGTQRLTRLIGKTKALELLMTGTRIYAEEALRLTLVNTVVPVEALDAAVEAVIKELRTKSAVTLGLLKLAVNNGLEMSLEQALYYEAECFGSALATEDSREGLKAFLDKRKAEFKGK